MGACLWCAVLLAASGPSSGNYAVQRWTMDAGGGQAEAAIHRVAATFGQADAGARLHSASYSLVGGFWAPVPPAGTLPEPIFSDGFEPVPDAGTMNGNAR